MAEITVLTDLNLDGNRVRNLSEPILSGDSATKAYVDNVDVTIVTGGTYTATTTNNVISVENQLTDLHLPDTTTLNQGKEYKIFARRVQVNVIPFNGDFIDGNEHLIIGGAGRYEMATLVKLKDGDFGIGL